MMSHGGPRSDPLSPSSNDGPDKLADVTDLPLLSVDGLKTAAKEFTNTLGNTPIEPLYGVTDGKAVGTYVEASFNIFVRERFTHEPGNAAKGIDFPDIDVDLKVTSIKQPQSSCPFRDATQKVFGLGYHLLVMVYEKLDDHANRTSALDFTNVIFIEKEFTADFQTTTGIQRIIEADGNVDDIDAFLEERNLPVDEIGRRQLAERIIETPPVQGYLTISNALQWRLQYGRAIQLAHAGDHHGLEDVIG